MKTMDKRQYVSFPGLFVQIRISSLSHWAQNTFFFSKGKLILPSLFKRNVHTRYFQTLTLELALGPRLLPKHGVSGAWLRRFCLYQQGEY